MTTQTVQPLPTSAAVWLNTSHALVARTDLDGKVMTVDVIRGVEPETSYLVRVVRAIGDRQRVMFLGPSSPRLALEREYVAVFQHPDRLVDVDAVDPTDSTSLAKRLSTLVA